MRWTVAGGGGWVKWVGCAEGGVVEQCKRGTEGFVTGAKMCCSCWHIVEGRRQVPLWQTRSWCWIDAALWCIVSSRGGKRWTKLRGFLLGNAIGIEVGSMVKIDHNRLLFSLGHYFFFHSLSSYTDEDIIPLLEDDIMCWVRIRVLVAVNLNYLLLLEKVSNALHRMNEVIEAEL